MRGRRSQFDMTHALTTHFGQGNFNTAFFADNTAMLEAFIFAA